MNPYKNILNKVKLLLKEDDQLTKVQCECHQWQLLIKIPGDYTFTVGKGGVNTIFYSLSSAERAVCYPDEILTILEGLAKSKSFGYLALDKSKSPIGYSIDSKVATKFKGARTVAAIDFTGKHKVVLRRTTDLHGKKLWQ